MPQARNPEERNNFLRQKRFVFSKNVFDNQNSVINLNEIQLESPTGT